MKRLIHQGQNKPLYKQIFHDLKQDIEKGKYRFDERILSEQEIGTFYNVSRITARQALEELEKAGYILRIQGKGSFVCWRKSETVSSLKESRMAKFIHAQYENIELSTLKQMKTISYIQKEYDVDNQLLGRIIEEDGHSEDRMTYYCYYPYLSKIGTRTFAPGKTVLTVYQQQNAYPRRLFQNVKAVISDKEIAACFHVPEGTVVLLTVFVIYDEKENLLELTVCFRRGSDSIINMKFE